MARRRQTRPFAAFVAFALAAGAAAAATGAATPADAGSQIVVPEGWQGAYDFGYAPAVRVGDTIWVAGIPAGRGETYEEKVRDMYVRAGEILAAAGAGFADVVEITTFHASPTGSQAFRDEFERYMPIHREFFGEHRPAWTAVGTTALLAPTAVVEMKLVAVVGSGAASRVVRRTPVDEAPATAAPPPDGTGDGDG